VDLSDPKTLRAFLAEHGISARKGLGQHFLCSPPAVAAVLSRLDGINGVLEIGPGPGVLTAPIASRVQHVIALEIDPLMIDALRLSAPRAEVIREDALKADLASILKTLPQPRAAVSNLPYYITAPLVTKIAEARELYQKAVLMMQKEVASRFLAKAGDRERGSISVYLQALFTISKVQDVPAAAFIPPPKVDSTILELAPNDTLLEPGLFEMVRKGFDQPRKTLANNLAGFHDLGRQQVQERLQKIGLPLTVRPHQLELEKWSELYREC